MASITTIETPLVLDLAINKGYNKVYGMQLDNGTRKLIVSLENNGEPYTIPSGVTVKLQGRRPDGAAIFKDCTIKNNQIHVVLTSYELAVPGDCELTITLYEGKPSSSGNFSGNQLSSFAFKVAVPKSPFSEDLVVSSKEFSLLTSTILKAEEAYEKSTEALSKADEALDRADDAIDRANDAYDKVKDLSDKLDNQIDRVDDAFDEIDDIKDRLEDAVKDAEDAADKAEKAADKIDDLLDEKYGEVFVLKDEVGVPNGVASLGNDGKVPKEQLPKMESEWFIGTQAELEAALAAGKIKEGTKVMITDD